MILEEFRVSSEGFERRCTEVITTTPLHLVLTNFSSKRDQILVYIESTFERP